MVYLSAQLPEAHVAHWGADRTSEFSGIQDTGPLSRWILGQITNPISANELLCFSERHRKDIKWLWNCEKQTSFKGETHTFLAWVLFLLGPELIIWGNYRDVSGGHTKWWFSKGITWCRHDTAVAWRSPHPPVVLQSDVRESPQNSQFRSRNYSSLPRIRVFSGLGSSKRYLVSQGKRLRSRIFYKSSFKLAKLLCVAQYLPYWMLCILIHIYI